MYLRKNMLLLCYSIGISHRLGLGESILLEMMVTDDFLLLKILTIYKR